MNREIMLCGCTLIVLIVNTALQATIPHFAIVSVTTDSFVRQISSDSTKPINSELEATLLAKRTIWFYPNRSDISAEFFKLLDAHAQYLITHPSVRVQLIRTAPFDKRYTDHSHLGRLRATAVKKYLLKHGAKPQQISVRIFRDSRITEGVGRYDQQQPIKINYLKNDPTT